ncbi:hypothetical protein [Piscinibacterium candidicorallinum]|uniref:DNA-binding protein n=1 Tax=Piscinibacterium candidicorallinum TaxID=1793872 RepID=A0ABV7H620_9BURK
MSDIGNSENTQRPATAEQVSELFRYWGVSVATWATFRGFNVALTYSLLQGRSKGLWGQSWEIARALGLKSAPQGGPSLREDLELLSRERAQRANRR